MRTFSSDSIKNDCSWKKQFFFKSPIFFLSQKKKIVCMYVCYWKKLQIYKRTLSTRNFIKKKLNFRTNFLFQCFNEKKYLKIKAFNVVCMQCCIFKNNKREKIHYTIFCFFFCCTWKVSLNTLSITNTQT